MISVFKNIFNHNKKPVFNILVRTSCRPNYFYSCYQSIIGQTYQKTNIIVSYDNDETHDYVKNYKNLISVDVSKVVPENFPEPEISRGKKVAKFPANLYLNQMMQHVKNGFIVYLDDDDMFTSPSSLETLAGHISGKDNLLFWRVQFPDGKLIPEDEYFRKPPQFWQIDTIGFAFHSKYITHAQWEGWKGGDYAVATKLYQVVPQKIYINQILTALQRIEGGGGFGKADDKKNT
jgi:hypothetical protein